MAQIALLRVDLFLFALALLLELLGVLHVALGKIPVFLTLDGVAFLAFLFEFTFIFADIPFVFANIAVVLANLSVVLFNLLNSALGHDGRRKRGHYRNDKQFCFHSAPFRKLWLVKALWIYWPCRF